MYAAEKGHKEVVEALIKAKAILDATNKVHGEGRGGGEDGGGRV